MPTPPVREPTLRAWLHHVDVADSGLHSALAHLRALPASVIDRQQVQTLDMMCAEVRRIGRRLDTALADMESGVITHGGKASEQE